MSTAVNENDDDILWNKGEDDRNARNEHQEDEGTDCEGDSDTDW